MEIYEKILKVIELYNEYKGNLNDDGTVMTNAQIAELIVPSIEETIDEKELDKLTNVSLGKRIDEFDNDEEYIEMMELLYGLNFMINSDKIKSSDINKAIEMVKKQNKRASGRSSRILNSIIEEFFQKPLGTHIAIYDHSTNKNDVKIMVNNVEKRLKNEYPYIKYKIGYELENPYIMRIE